MSEDGRPQLPAPPVAFGGHGERLRRHGHRQAGPLRGGRHPDPPGHRGVDPGRPGHSEVGAATAHAGIQPVRIDGYPATLEGVDGGAYPYRQTEYGYTYGEPAADSLAASSLRYLSDEVGKDIIRSHGDRPCEELAKPLLCRPSQGSLHYARLGAKSQGFSHDAGSAARRRTGSGRVSVAMSASVTPSRILRTFARRALHRGRSGCAEPV